MIRNASKSLVPVLVALACLFGGAASARAQTTTTYGSGGSSNTFTGGTINPGDTVLLNNGATVTGNVTANGTLQFNQSAGNTLTISNLISGTGTLSLTNTGTLNLTPAPGAPHLPVVLDMTTSASLGLLQINAASGLLVGGSGTGTLNVTGGSVTSTDVTLGYDAGGTGTLNVTGGRVSNTAGTLGSQAGSVGTATVSSGTWANSGGLTVGSSGTGTLNVTGGYVSNTDGTLGSSAGSVGTATVSSGTWANSGGLTVGYVGTGTLNVTGGRVSNTAGTLGSQAGSVGTVTVSGSGTWANSGDLFVGLSGTGMLNVTGGSVTSANGALGGGFVVGEPPVVVSGVGTATVSSGTWANSGDLVVGLSGTGTLNVTGGSVTNTNGVLGGFWIDSGEGEAVIVSGVGTATVSSGTWANSGDLFVGFSGTGTLTVNGGSVTNTFGYIGGGQDGEGNLVSCVGTATVSSGTWASVGLGVGMSGTGTLNVTGGCIISAESALGLNAGSVGTATVSSGTWANNGDLYVGIEGIGTLNLNGGLVTVGGTLSTGTSGTINLNSGGTLQIGVGGTTGVLDVSTLTNNGTLVFNRSDASNYSGIINGTGAVTKQGAGTLTLDGANSYSGGTTISGGVLALSGTGSVGTGDLNLGSGGVFDLTALTSGTYSLPSTGDLIGSGTLTGNGHTLAVLGAFQPGNSPGTVTLDTGFTLDLSGAASTTFDITNPLFTAGTYDLVNGNGSMIFGGILNLTFSGGSYDNGTDVLQLFANTGGFSGDFDSVVSTGLAAGQFATFNATTGFVSVVPEPSTYAMALAGLACGSWQMWRRRRLRQAPTLAA